MRQYGFTKRFYLSGTEPQHDPHRPDVKPPAPSSPPGLVFQPDVRQAMRVSRVRMFTLVAAAILMVVALLLILSYRPPPVALEARKAPWGNTPPTESTSTVSPEVPSQPAPPQSRVNSVGIARTAVAGI